MRKLKLAMEIPVPHLEELSPLTDFDFILAEPALHNESYRKFYLHQQEIGRESMLDNSMWENGGVSPMSFEDLCIVIGMMNPTEVIVPDTFGFTEITIGQAVQWMDYQEWHPIISKYHLQLVVQGSTMDGALDCYKRLLEMAKSQNEHLNAYREDLAVTSIAFPLGIGCPKEKKESWVAMREAILANIALHKEYDSNI
jgi:hypothetical protein